MNEQMSDLVGHPVYRQNVFIFTIDKGGGSSELTLSIEVEHS